MSRKRRSARTAGLLLSWFLPVCSLAAADKEKIARLSFGDAIDSALQITGDWSSKVSIEKTIAKLKQSGFTTIYWRLVWDGHPVPEAFRFYSSQLVHDIARIQKEMANTPYAWDPHEIRWPLEVAHKQGMKFFAWVTLYNEGCPPGSYRDYGVPPTPIQYPWGLVYQTENPWQTNFVYNHPEYQMVDRSGKRYHCGNLEWAYPEARQYWVNEVKLILEKYDVDGIHVNTRTEGPSPEHADQFGFNEPVVKEYERRYGVNILEEDFDLEKWRSLRGEYFTQLLRELSQVIHAKGKIFSLGTSAGDYIGYPLGNMKLEWRKWISEKLIDWLNLNELGWGFGKQGYGYLTDYATGRGLKPFDQAVREDYGPLCKEHGVRLNFLCVPKGPSTGPRPTSHPCCMGRATPSAIKHPPDYCETMPRMPEFSGVIFQAPRQKATP